MEMEKRNYDAVMETNPMVLMTIVNQRGQIIELLEGDREQILAAFHEKKIIGLTDFFDTGDFYTGSEYLPMYAYNMFGYAHDFDLNRFTEFGNIAQWWGTEDGEEFDITMYNNWDDIPEDLHRIIMDADEANKYCLRHGKELVNYIKM